MSFIETPRFPECISIGAQGGPGYSTNIITLASGFEQRNMNWEQSRARYTIGESARTPENMRLLLAWFRSMKGRAHGFRFKDHVDYQVERVASANNFPLGFVGGGVGTGARSYQLVARYAIGSLVELRQIRKPVAGSVKLYANGVLIGTASVDSTTGIVTLTPLASAVINSITQANPGVVTTSAAHLYTSGQAIYLHNITGMTQVNARAFVITLISPTQFHLGEDTSAYSAYTSGTGQAHRYYQPSDVLTWDGEFDVPVRFDTDNMDVGYISKKHFDWQDVALVELRV